MRLAIASTIADEPQQVDYFIRYHLSVGFDRLYLYFDAPGEQAIDVARRYPQVDVTVCDKQWREQSIEFIDSINESDSALYDTEVMIRQEMNVRFAIERARNDHMTWLLHIDSDELFYTPSSSARTHFSELDKRGARNVIYRNSEALIHSGSTDSPFRSTTLFKRNFFGNNGWSYTPGQRKYLISLGMKPEYYFHFYQNGKSAVRLDQNIEVEGVHFFLTENPPLTWNQDKARILHFPCPTYRSFEQKYRRLGEFSDSWRGGPRVGDFISLVHLQARDAYLSRQDDALKTLFVERIAIDDPQVINELRSWQLLDEISNIHERFLTREALVGEIETQQNSLHKRCLVWFTGRQCSASSITQFNSLFARFNQIIRQIYPAPRVAEQVILDSVERVTEMIPGQPPFISHDTHSREEYEWFDSCRFVGARLTLEQMGSSVAEIRARLGGLRDLGVNYLSLLGTDNGTGLENSGSEEMARLIPLLTEYGIAFGTELRLDDHQGNHQPFPDDPRVFNAVLSHLLHLTRLGSHSIHLTGMSGTGNRHGSEHQSGWSLIIEAYRILASLISPRVTLVSDIIHCPEVVRQFVATEGASLGYRPLLTAALWQSVMSGEVRILRAQLSRWSALPGQCNWINSLSYDYEIEWAFSESTLADQNPDMDIRVFCRQLTSFYQNSSDRSFSRGYQNGNSGIVGTAASLSGLEKAMITDNSVGIEKSINRILLLHAVIFSIGGLPMISYGDELADINSQKVMTRKNIYIEDNKMLSDIKKVESVSQALKSEHSFETKVYRELKKLIRQRSQISELSKHQLTFIDVQDSSCLVYLREDKMNQFLFIGNFSPIKKKPGWLGGISSLGKYQWENVLENNEVMPLPEEIEPYQYFWFRRNKVNTGELK